MAHTLADFFAYFFERSRKGDPLDGSYADRAALAKKRKPTRGKA